MKKKYFFGWQNLKWLIKEFVKTFSNEPSFFSSKRIERAFLFINALAIMDLFVYKNYDKLTSTEVLALFGAHMAYAGWQTKQIFNEIKSKKNEVNSTPPDNNSNTV